MVGWVNGWSTAVLPFVLKRVQRRIMMLPDETRVFVGHDYLPKDGERKEFAWETTVGDEKRHFPSMLESRKVSG